MEKRFTSENFETEVLKSDVPVLVDFMPTGAVRANEWHPS